MNAKIYQLAILSLTVQIFLVMIHCKGYAHPKPGGMSDTEHVEFHHGKLETYERLEALEGRVEKLEKKYKDTSNRVTMIEGKREGEKKREEARARNNFIALLVIGGIVFTAIIIKRGLKSRRQIRRG